MLLPETLTNVLSEAKKQTTRSQYFNDPVLWAKEVAGVTLWSRQRDISYQVRDNRNTAIKAAHGVGKSFLTAVLICWWVDTRYPDIFVVSTAPSRAQIGAIVWREIRMIKRRIEQRHRDGLVDHILPGYITADHEWKTDDGQVFAFGRRPPEQSEGDMVQGIHARYVLAIGDEAVGLTANMINALQNITSNQYSRRLLIANPTNPNCAFGEIFLDERLKESGVWSTGTISVFDSPNFTDERFELPPEVLAELTGTDYADDMEREYGRDSAQYISRVLGEFARDTDAPYLFKEEDINEALDTEIIPRSDDQVVLGVDVARFGKDLSVIYKAQAGRVRFVAREGGETRVTEVANWVHRHAIDLNASEVRVDGLGIGGGVVDTLLSFPDRKYRLVSMNASGATQDSRRWHNARAMWFDTFRSNMRAGLIDLDLEDEHFDVLKNELLDLQYKYNASTGGIVIESKDDIRKRGGRSPDFADAAVFAALGAEDYAPQEEPRKSYLYEDPSLYVQDETFYLQLM